MIAAKKPKRKKCRICSELFEPRNTLAVVCSWQCGRVVAQDRELIRKVLGNARRAEKRETRVRLRTRRDWMKLAQMAFNGWIRERDRLLPCISCGRHDPNVKRNAGHYLSVGSHPELRFNELNCHAQCEHCNSYKSGNAVAYRVGLVRKIGIANVEMLEGPHAPKKYTVSELQDLIAEFKTKAKVLAGIRVNAASMV